MFEDDFSPIVESERVLQYPTIAAHYCIEAALFKFRCCSLRQRVTKGPETKNDDGEEAPLIF